VPDIPKLVKPEQWLTSNSCSDVISVRMDCSTSSSTASGLWRKLSRFKFLNPRNNANLVSNGTSLIPEPLVGPCPSERYLEKPPAYRQRVFRSDSAFPVFDSLEDTPLNGILPITIPKYFEAGSPPGPSSLPENSSRRLNQNNLEKIPTSSNGVPLQHKRRRHFSVEFRVIIPTTVTIING